MTEEEVNKKAEDWADNDLDHGIYPSIVHIKVKKAFISGYSLSKEKIDQQEREIAELRDCLSGSLKALETIVDEKDFPRSIAQNAAIIIIQKLKGNNRLNSEQNVQPSVATKADSSTNDHKQK